MMSDFPQPTNKPKKRQVNGRAKQAAKKRRIEDHTPGPQCGCNRLKCFENVSAAEREHLIMDFVTNYASKDDQDSYLSTLITVLDVTRRRSRMDDDSEANYHSKSYQYHVNIVRGELEAVSVCHKAFLSIFGITNRRVQTIKSALAKTGMYFNRTM